MIAEGKVNCASLITGVGGGLDGLDNDFNPLRNTEQHANILIDPYIRAVKPKKATNP